MNKNNYLALGGLFVAMHLLFIFIAKFLAGSELILVVFLPLLSTIYALKYNKGALIGFIIATLFLCGIFEPIATFIYVLPALICGSVYGILRKKRVKELSLIYFSSLAHSISLLIAFIAISLMFKEVNFFNIFAKFIKKEGEAFYVSIYLILILLGVLESFLTHIITNNELKRLGYKELETEDKTPTWMLSGVIISGICYLVLALINPILSCYAFPFLLGFMLPLIVEGVITSQNKFIYLSVGVLFLISLFIIRYVSLIFYPLLILGIFLPFILEKIGRVLYTILLKYSNNGKNKIK